MLKSISPLSTLHSPLFQMNCKLILVAALAALAGRGLEAKVAAGTPFADNMVLQRDCAVPVWGTADAGERVTVSFAGQEKSATADAQGAWRVALDPMPASKENRELTVTGAANSETFRNVLVGEVWFASGQSNMECPIWSDNPRYRDGKGGIMTAMTRRPYIRYARNPRVWSATPRHDWKATWRDFSPESFRETFRGNLSAVAFYYALELYGALEVPVGIIDSSWGGTNIDAWTPRSGYASHPELKDVADFPVTAEWNASMRKGVIGDAKQQPTAIWNGMVAAWAPYAIKGFIWYQGCHNNGESHRYRDKMHALYDGWAKEFANPDLKLYFVMLAPYRANWFNLQQAQSRFAAEEKNAALVVSCDAGNRDDIHPNDKEIIAKRLALHAFRRDYGFTDIVDDSPTVKSWTKTADGQVRLSFNDATGWYVYNANRSDAQGFEIAGPDGRFVPAKVMNKGAAANTLAAGRLEGAELVVAAKGVTEPMRLRYLANAPGVGALYAFNSGLPVGPFELDLSKPCADALATGFGTVPDSAKPWCYWWWQNGHVDKETITADLEAMKRLGFGGLLMFDSRGYWDDEDHVKMAPAEIAFMSPEWQEYVVHAIREAARLGLKFSMNMSSSGGKLDGPWDVGADAPKRLVYKIYPAGTTSFEPADLPFYHEIAAQTVWYVGDELVADGVWRNGGDGVYTMSESSGARLDGDCMKARTLVAEGTPGAKGVVVRFGYTVLPGHEHDVDVLDPKAVTGHYLRFQGELQKKIPGLVGRDKTLSALYSVSWEGTMPTWTGNFVAEFRRFTGRDILRDLPLLAGFEWADAVANETFRRAYRRARNDMFRENFYGTMRDLSHARNLDWYSESGGPWNRKPALFREADQIEYLGVNDLPQGEFWPVGRQPSGKAILRNGLHARFHVRGAVASAHLYGREKASAEAFTHMLHHWSVDPAFLKGMGDEGYLCGVNHYVWHTFTCNPKKFGVPGHEYFAGSHINRNVTWHRQAAAFINYLGRCQWMLQQGLPVEDYAVYAGDRPYQHWGTYDEKPYNASKANLPRGYAYDIVNDDAILNRFMMKDGRLTLPNGISYGALVWDPEFTDEPLKAEVLAKVEAFGKAGLKVVSAAEAREAVAGVLPDYEGPFKAVHRRDAATDTDIYFIAGTGAGTMTFRAPKGDRAVELWCPVSGTRWAAEATARADGRTDVKVDLPKDGALFVVFRPTPASAAPKARAHALVKAVTGPWQVSFAYPDGITQAAPQPVTMKALRDFTSYGAAGVADSASVRYFSGTATYRTKVTLTDEEAARAQAVGLGELPTGLAEVSVNGRNLGVVWCAPWRVVAKDAFKAGANDIKVRYVNNWYNRLVGDCFLPAEKRVTTSCLQYRNGPRAGGDGQRRLNVYAGYATDDPLQSSGLKGPIAILGF